MLSNYTSSLKAAFENNKRQCGKPFRNFLYSRLRAHFWFAMEGTIIYLYYMATFVGLQDEPDRALLMATRAGKMELTWPLGTSRRRLPREKFARKLNNIFFIVQTFSPAMAGYWPCSSFACLWTSNLCCSINTQKQNLANIQQSWPHAWSISHISIVRQPKLGVDNTWNMEHSWAYRNIEYL